MNEYSVMTSIQADNSEMFSVCFDNGERMLPVYASADSVDIDTICDLLNTAFEKGQLNVLVATRKKAELELEHIKDLVSSLDK